MNALDRKVAAPPAPLSVRIEEAAQLVDRSRTALGPSQDRLLELGRLVHLHAAGIAAAVREVERGEFKLPFTWCVRAGHLAVLRELMRVDGVAPVRVEQLNGSPQSARRVIFDIRKKIAAFVPRFDIVNVPWQGYYLAADVKARLRQAIEEASR